MRIHIFKQNAICQLHLKIQRQTKPLKIIYSPLDLSWWQGACTHTHTHTHTHKQNMHTHTCIHTPYACYTHTDIQRHAHTHTTYVWVPWRLMVFQERWSWLCTFLCTPWLAWGTCVPVKSLFPVCVGHPPQTGGGGGTAESSTEIS